MTRDIEIMNEIQTEKVKDIAREQRQPLDKEGTKMAEHKRFTFDIIDTPVDPLR